MVGGRWGVAADHDPFLALYSAFDHFQTICVTNHLCQTRRVQPSVSDTKGETRMVLLCRSALG